MKVLFLDIDGVLNTPGYCRSRDGKTLQDCVMEQKVQDVSMLFEPESEFYVEDLKTVISSSWRYFTDIETFRDVLGPLKVQDCLMEDTDKTRWECISDYLEDRDVGDYLILDDQNVAERQVQVSSVSGVQLGDVRSCYIRLK